MNRRESIKAALAGVVAFCFEKLARARESIRSNRWFGWAKGFKSAEKIDLKEFKRLTNKTEWRSPFGR